MDLKIMFRENITLPLPDGDVLEFTANEWYFYKPKWATTFPMGDFIDFAVLKNVVIKDVNNDIFDLSLIDDLEEKKRIVSKNIAWVARFSL